MTTATVTKTDDRQLLVRLIDEAYRRSTWNDANLRSSVKGISAREAAWKPSGARHSVAEIILHCAYWKYAVRRRLLRDRRRTFPLKGRDWFEVPETLTAEQWSEHLAILDAEHEKLTEAVADSGDDLLYASEASRAMTRQLFGIAMHDAYHTGQVQLIRAQHRRAREKTGSSREGRS